MWPAGGARLRRGGRAAGAAARRRRRRCPTTRAAAEQYAARAPGPPGGAHRRGRDPGRVRRTARCGCGPTTTRCPCVEAPDLVPGPPRVAAQHPRELTRRPDERETRERTVRRRHPRAGAARAARRVQQRSRALIGTIIVLVVAFFLVSVFTGVWTDRLWFASVGYSSVFTKVLGTKVLLFLVFGLLMAGVVAANMVVAYRFRPLFRPALAGAGQPRPLPRGRSTPLRTLAAGRRSRSCSASSPAAPAPGSGGTYLLWRHRRAVRHHRPLLPQGRRLLRLRPAVAALPGRLRDGRARCSRLLAAAVVHYLYGGIRLQATQRPALRRRAGADLGAGSGSSCWSRRVDYWLDRYDLITDSGGLFTGMGYTDQHAVLPAKNILMFIALICAVLFFANVWRRTWLLPVGRAGAARALLDPARRDLARHRAAVPGQALRAGQGGAVHRARTSRRPAQAYDIDDTKVTPYDAQRSTLTAAQLQTDAAVAPGRPAGRPAAGLRRVRAAPAGARLLQRAAGARRRPLPRSTARDRDAGARRPRARPERPARRQRELGQPAHRLHPRLRRDRGLRQPAATPTTSRSPTTTASRSGPSRTCRPRASSPTCSPGGYQPRIYFGENSPDYSIVGKAPGRQDVELDLPEGQRRRASTTNTYDGKAGVAGRRPVQQAAVRREVRRAEHRAVRAGSTRTARSSTTATPRERVQKVAPWLTVDGDAYPAVVDGRVDVGPRRLHHHRPVPAQPRRTRCRTMTDGRAAARTRRTPRCRPTRSTTCATRSRRPSTPTTARSTLYAWDEHRPDPARPGRARSRTSVQAEVRDPAGPARSTCATPRTCSRCSATCSRATTSPTRRRSTTATTSGRCPRTRRTRRTSSRRTGSRCRRRRAARTRCSR